MGRYQRVLVGVDGSTPSLHTLKEALGLAPESLTAVAVLPSAGASPRAAAAWDQALARARELGREAGVNLDTVALAGEPYRGIVDLALARDCELIVLGLKGPDLPEEVLMGSTTARVIGYSPRDVLVIPYPARLAFGRVLLPTDGSRYSDKALARALRLCQAYGGELLVVSVLDAPPDFDREAPEAAAAILAGLHGYVAAAQSRAAALGIGCLTQVGQGPAYQVITALARERQIDLIVMGSHGRTGLKRLLMGSVTERVLGLAPCPVLVAKG
jgi:nucleotide-binding universal stress UspA family protein